MAKIITIHSFRGGTGKTNLSANVAALLTRAGLRVGLIDTDIQSPGAHVLFGIDEDSLPHTLNDYVWGKCKIEAAAKDVTSVVENGARGKLFLVPSSIRASDVAKILREGYSETKLGDGLGQLNDALELDVLIVDTHPGCNDVTLLTMALANTLGLMLRPDQQDYQGTGVTMRIAESLEVPNVKLIVNKSPALFNSDMVKTKVEQAYGTDVAAVLPHADEMMALGSGGLFIDKYPNHPLTAGIKNVVVQLME